MVKRKLGIKVASVVITVLLALAFLTLSAEAKKTVTIWTAFPQLHEFTVAVGKKYMQEHPDIEIKATLYPQRAQEEKVAVALPTGQAADLIELDKFELYPYYADGFLEPLPDDMAKWVQENWPADAVQATTDKGKMFCFPWFTAVKVMFYNKDYFQKAGVTATPETVDDMLAIAKKLVRRDKDGNVIRAGLDFRLSGGGAGTAQKFWCQAMVPYGANFIEKVGDKWRAGYDNEAGFNAFMMYLNAIYRDKIEGFDIKSDAEGFGLGLSAMFQRETWVATYLEKNAPQINYGVFLMPKGPGGWGNVGNTMGLGLSKASKNKKEALDFARYLMNDENTVKMFRESGWQPYRVNVDYSEIYAKYPVMEVFVDALQTPGHKNYDYENIPAISEIHNRFAERLMRAFKMKELYEDPAKLKAYIHNMARQTNEILEEHDLLAE